MVGTWIAPACDRASGGSVVLWVLPVVRFFQRECRHEHKFLWLPDVLGYSGALPQILKNSGVDYFMTTKLVVMK